MRYLSCQRAQRYQLFGTQNEIAYVIGQDSNAIDDITKTILINAQTTGDFMKKVPTATCAFRDR